jgi:hypothetical protein
MSDKFVSLISILIVLQIFVVLLFRKAGDRILTAFDPLFKPILNWVSTWGQSVDDVTFDRELSRIMESNPNALSTEAERVIMKYGRVKGSGPRVDEAILSKLPRLLRLFLERYDSLSFHESDRSIDKAIMETLEYQGRHYAVFGTGEEEGEFFATSLEGKGDIVRIHLKERKIAEIEPLAASIEQFILLRLAFTQHADAILAKRCRKRTPGARS